MALITFMVLLLLSWSSLLTCCSAAAGGLRLELTHVDAKGNYTTAERVRRAVDGSRRRLASMAAGDDVSAPVRWVQMHYIAEYHIGDPPQRAEALIDTGSDLVWTQCMTCGVGDGCFNQNLPYYNFSDSRSVRRLPCTDAACLANDGHFCSWGGDCAFFASYGAGNIGGSLGTEVFAFQTGTAALTFGCVGANAVTPGALDGASGIIGLGRGNLSLVSQTGTTKFSYCLTPYFSENAAPSKLLVGDTASLTGDGPVTSVPFVKNPEGSTFYYLPLLAITVGRTKLPIPSKLFEIREDNSGGVIIDSGSPFTSLVNDAYQALTEELTKQLNHSLVTPPASTELQLCMPLGDVAKVAPPLVLHFSGDADMTWPPENYWTRIENDTSTACMAIENAGNVPMTIIGNFQQQNMHLLYDLAGGQLSFQTADCSSL